MRLLLAAVAGLTFATAAQADQLIIDVPNLQDAPAKTAAQPKEKVICKSDNAIGSLVKKNRWCATAAEWRESERSAKVWVGNMQADKGRYNPDGGPAVDVYMGVNGIRFGGH